MSQTAAGAMGARTARACDSCLRWRARWYCAADDAFLCQGCDNSVHSANQLARRHERVRLKTASASSTFKLEVGGGADCVDGDPTAPSWHRAVKRKARSPRSHKQGKGDGEQLQGMVGRTWSLVPDLEERAVEVEEEEDLIYRVPIFDPVLSELCSSRESLDDGFGGDGGASADETKPAVTPSAATPAKALPEFLPPDVDTGDFALDVESLLGRDLDQESFCMDDLGLSGSKVGDDSGRVFSARGNVKVKKEEEAVVDENRAFPGTEMDPSTDTFEINFGCDSPAADEGSEPTDRKRKRVMLKLDYEWIINACSAEVSPWADGERPKFDPDGCCLDNTELMLGVGGELVMIGGSQTVAAANATIDVGREARVSRYREKRRTRLFSKKIRYEVRKLNAEKRPRMKGRFVKRTTFAATAPRRAASSFAAPPPFVF